VNQRGNELEGSPGGTRSPAPELRRAWPAPSSLDQSLSQSYRLNRDGMKRERFSEEQIIGLLSEAKQTGKTRELCGV